MNNKKKRVIEFAKKRYDENDFKYHIIPVVRNALILADKKGADKEVVEVAAYLHDITRSFKRGAKDKFNFAENEHHVTGAAESKKILKEIGYNNEFIGKVAHCILAHRGRKDIKRETLEAEIIACADAMAHFDSFLDLFLAFMDTTRNFDTAVNEIEKKIERDWSKKLIFPEAKAMMTKKYEAIKVIIKSMKEYM